MKSTRKIDNKLMKTVEKTYALPPRLRHSKWAWDGWSQGPNRHAQTLAKKLRNWDLRPWVSYEQISSPMGGGYILKDSFGFPNDFIDYLRDILECL